MNEYCLHFRRGATVYLLIALACLGSALCEALILLGYNMVVFISVLHFLIGALQKRMVHVEINMSNFPLTLKLCGKIEIFSNLPSWAAGSPFQSRGFRRNPHTGDRFSICDYSCTFSS